MDILSEVSNSVGHWGPVEAVVYMVTMLNHYIEAVTCKCFCETVRDRLKL